MSSRKQTRLAGRLLPLCLTTVLGLWIAWAPALAAGGKPATKLVNVADTRVMAPGIARWIADVYNSSLWIYSGLVVVTMIGMGLGLGLLSDIIISRLGINLGKLEHHE